MAVLDQGEVKVAVHELRAFIVSYEGVEVPRGSRLARKLEHARKAVRAFDEAETRERRTA